MQPKTPIAINHSHSNLCLELKIITNNHPHLKTEIQTFNKVMRDHFKKEEKYALPPLGLLLDLSEGKWELEEDAIVKMTKSLYLHLVELKQEHENIYKHMQDLNSIAEEENNSDLKRFIKNLEIHMELEDQVLYPASMLIGNFFGKFKHNI